MNKKFDDKLPQQIGGALPINATQPQAPVPSRGGRPKKHKKMKVGKAPAVLGRLRKDNANCRPLLHRLAQDYPGDPFKQLKTFFDEYRLPAAIGRKRFVSNKTEAKYRKTMSRALATLT